MFQQKSVTGTGVTDPVMLNVYGFPNITMQMDITSTGTTALTVQETLQDVQTLGATGVTWLTATGNIALSGVAANAIGVLTHLPRAVRLSQTTGTGVAQFTVIQAGLRGI